MNRPAATLKGTIEFRQHTGTLDYLEIIAWVQFVIKMVEYSANASHEDFLDLIMRGADNQFFLEDLLVALDVHEDVIDHYLNSPVIGVLHDINQEFTPIEDTDDLIEQNDHEFEDRVEEDAVLAAIQSKYEDDAYGIDPSRAYTTTPHQVNAELQRAMVTASVYTGWDLGQRVSYARAQVLRQFAELYRNPPRQSHQLPLNSVLEELTIEE